MKATEKEQLEVGIIKRNRS